MKIISKTVIATAGVALVLGLGSIVPVLKPLGGLLPAAQAAGEHVLTYDVACDCRTGVAGPNRNDPFIIQGKIFPAGTLPRTPTATNDPVKPVNGVAPIGDWICRGQNSFPLPADIFPAYSSTPFAFNAQYFILNNLGTLTAEGVNLHDKGLLSITGGFGGFSGAAGDIEGVVFGTNATGCPNFRATLRVQPGSVRGSSNR